MNNRTARIATVRAICTPNAKPVDWIDAGREVVLEEV